MSEGIHDTGHSVPREPRVSKDPAIREKLLEDSLAKLMIMYEDSINIIKHLLPLAKRVVSHELGVIDMGKDERIRYAQNVINVFDSVEKEDEKEKENG